MRLLALDLATKTGWAHSNGASGVQDFSPRRGDSPGMRWINFRSWLLRLIEAAPVDLIVYEQAAYHRSLAANHVAHGLIAAVESVATECNIELTSRSPTAIKKYALPNIKKRNKTRMVMAAENKWPDVSILSDDQADALWLLDLVLSELGGK